MSSQFSSIQFRRGTATEWNDANTILGSGEPGYDLTSKILKIGDGITAWSGLSGIISGSSSASEINDLTSIVTWANVPDANITQSSVIQHSGALAINTSQINNFNTEVSGLLPNNIVVSDTTGITGASGISNIVYISQQDYDNLSSYNSNTLYFIQ